MNPRFFRIESNCSFSSGECSGESGLILGDGLVR